MAAELEPAVAEGKYAWLYTMNIFRNAAGDCSSDDMEDVYSKDEKGRFTRKSRKNRQPCAVRLELLTRSR